MTGCHPLLALPRERQVAGLRLANNANSLQAQLALPRERQVASSHLANNANSLQAQLAAKWVQAQIALPENFPLGTFQGKAQWLALALENLSSCRKVLKLSQERLKEKVFRPLRRSAKDAVFGNCHLLEKVDENFASALLCRESIRVRACT